jgi:DNA-binding GntR family transcriptional regulator
MKTGKPSQNATVDTYATLKERIVHLQYRPGEVLMVQRLATEIGVSRTPVREALVRLTEEDLVQPTDGRKFQVAPLTLKNVDELFEVREALEPLVAMGAARSHTEDDLARLQSIIDEMDKALHASDIDVFMENDWKFHDEIAEIHGNRTLETLLARLRGRIQRIRHLTQHLYHRMDDTIGEHRAIIDAIRTGKAASARKALLSHLEKTHGQLRDYLANSTGLGLPLVSIEDE